MGFSYGSWIRGSLLREEPGPILSESILQRIWFEQLIRNPLTTQSGQALRVHQPGFWNHRAGPDFLQASFSRTDGILQTGDVEIHRHSSDWSRHGHGSDPAYANVRLHVFWQADPTRPNLSGAGVHPIALEHQLSAPLTGLLPLFRSTPEERGTGERPGSCRSQWLSLPAGKLGEILEEAGWHRLRQRRALAQARRSTLGLDQAIWISLAEGLGFSENRQPFISLARMVPIKTLLPLPMPSDRAALLFGSAGLLPDPTRHPVNSRALPLVRQLWDRWWRLGRDWSHPILPPTTWRLGGARPNNSPLRRLAALEKLSHPSVWQSFVNCVRIGDYLSFLGILRSLGDPFWDHHASWGGRILSSSSKLVGTDRATSLLFQVLAPLTDLTEAELGRQMQTWPPGVQSGPLRSASMRLLGAPFPPADVQTHLAREGLLQIYKDFCRSRPCQGCPMTDLLESRF